MRVKGKITKILQLQENKLVQNVWGYDKKYISTFWKKLPLIITWRSFYQNASLCSGSFRGKFGGDVSRTRIDSVQENPPLVLKKAQGKKQMARQFALPWLGIKALRVSNFSCMFLNRPTIFPIWIWIVLILLDLRNLQEQVKKHFVTKSCSDLSLFV